MAFRPAAFSQQRPSKAGLKAGAVALDGKPLPISHRLGDG